MESEQVSETPSLTGEVGGEAILVAARELHQQGFGEPLEDLDSPQAALCIRQASRILAAINAPLRRHISAQLTALANAPVFMSQCVDPEADRLLREGIRVAANEVYLPGRYGEKSP